MLISTVLIFFLIIIIIINCDKDCAKDIERERACRLNPFSLFYFLLRVVSRRKTNSRSREGFEMSLFYLFFLAQDKVR